MDAALEIKNRLDVADLIGEYLPLKPAGSGAFKAVCPFHQEKTPSFYVSRTRQTWHCFGCDQGGDVISFVMQMEGMEFREALEHLAQKAGVTLPSFDGERASHRKRIHEVNEMAMKHFRSVLESHPGAEIAREYVKRRGVDTLTADLFGLGYSLNEWSNLADALVKKGVTADELLKAGLVASRESGSGVYDRFRGRLMFPILDIHGNVAGFTGRILTDDKKEAKYVNTPETDVYKKSSVLYGLDKAKGEIRQKDLAIITEGNMDVIGSHQFNIANVVAASGTALTADQLALLKRFTTNLAIAFDQDAAGNAATLRGLDLARAQDFSIKIITLPPEAGKDPDEAVRKDPKLWQQAIHDAVSIMEWVYRKAFRDRRSEMPEDKKKIAAEVLPEIRRIVDPIERDHWLSRLARDLSVSDQALREALSRSTGPSSPSQKTPMPRGRTVVEARNPDHSPEYEMERQVLALTLYRPALFKAAQERFGLESGMFSLRELSTLYERLKTLYSSEQDIHSTSAGLNPSQVIRPPAGLTPDEAKQYDSLAFLAEREFSELDARELERELERMVQALRGAYRTRERSRLEQEMREAERVGDQARIGDLLKEFERLR